MVLGGLFLMNEGVGGVFVPQAIGCLVLASEGAGVGGPGVGLGVGLGAGRGVATGHLYRAVSPQLMHAKPWQPVDTAQSHALARSIARWRRGIE